MICIDKLPCLGKELEFIRPVMINLQKMTDQQIQILENLKKTVKIYKTTDMSMLNIKIFTILLS